MDRIEESRIAWLRAQADVQVAIATVERLLADKVPSPLTIERARELVKHCQKDADEMLQRHITQLGKN